MYMNMDGRKRCNKNQEINSVYCKMHKYMRKIQNKKYETSEKGSSRRTKYNKLFGNRWHKKNRDYLNQYQNSHYYGYHAIGEMICAKCGISGHLYAMKKFSSIYFFVKHSNTNHAVGRITKTGEKIGYIPKDYR
jgi:hypothetical protein